MKKLVLLLTLALALTVTGCGKSDKKEETKTEQKAEVTTPAPEVTNGMLEGLEMPKLMDAEEPMVKDLYGIDPTLLSSYVVKMPMMTGQPFEIAVFQVKDAKDVETVKKAIETRKEALLAPGVNYPSVNDAAGKSLVLNNGKYVAFIMTNVEEPDTATKLEENFNKLTK